MSNMTTVVGTTNPAIQASAGATAAQDDPQTFLDAYNAMPKDAQAAVLRALHGSSGAATGTGGTTNAIANRSTLAVNSGSQPAAAATPYKPADGGAAHDAAVQALIDNFDLISDPDTGMTSEDAIGAAVEDPDNPLNDGNHADALAALASAHQYFNAHPERFAEITSTKTASGTITADGLKKSLIKPKAAATTTATATPYKPADGGVAHDAAVQALIDNFDLISDPDTGMTSEDAIGAAVENPDNPLNDGNHADALAALASAHQYFNAHPERFAEITSTKTAEGTITADALTKALIRKPTDDVSKPPADGGAANDAAVQALIDNFSLLGDADTGKISETSINAALADPNNKINAEDHATQLAAVTNAVTYLREHPQRTARMTAAADAKGGITLDDLQKNLIQGPMTHLQALEALHSVFPVLSSSDGVLTMDKLTSAANSSAGASVSPEQQASLKRAIAYFHAHPEEFTFMETGGHIGGDGDNQFSLDELTSEMGRVQNDLKSPISPITHQQALQTLFDNFSLLSSGGTLIDMQSLATGSGYALPNATPEQQKAISNALSYFTAHPEEGMNLDLGTFSGKVRNGDARPQNIADIIAAQGPLDGKISQGDLTAELQLAGSRES